MSTRRTYAFDGDAPSSPTADGSAPRILDPADPPVASNIMPAVPMSVVMKLLFFTFMMVVAPISTYFLSVDRVFSGNATYAGASAAVVANLVLVGYIIVAIMEDQGDPETEKKKWEIKGGKSE